MMCLTTHVAELLRFLKYSNDADALTSLVDNEEYFRRMDRETLKYDKYIYRIEYRYQ